MFYEPEKNDHGLARVRLKPVRSGCIVKDCFFERGTKYTGFTDFTISVRFIGQLTW